MKASILIIEDDPDIQELLEYNLEKHGFLVHITDNGERGLSHLAENTPDIVLIDVMLPGMDGIEVCKSIKLNPKFHHIPVILLTAKSQESDIIVGLELGADDYITKPFSLNELIARVKAVLRRRAVHNTENLKKEAPNIIGVGQLKIDFLRHEAYFGPDPLSLTLTEFKLLSTLLKMPGRVYTREQLLQNINDHDVHVIDRNIDVHIRSIRKKLGEHSEIIATVRGVGYKCLDPYM
jgi:two-component system phosphate regulon response regulator PhoB